MANTPDMASCFASAEEHELLPSSPFYTLSYHFGMLLGVDDFETEQAYHRAKQRLHNAWLHREGVVWGFDLRLDVPRGEIRVLPGLALDASGHELHLEADACLNVAQWFEAHRNDAGFEFAETDSGIKFNAHVVMRFKACLTRQVPSLADPCEGANTATAYSRVFETVEILVRPGRAPARTHPYHRLRLLFGLESPSVDEGRGTVTAADQKVLDALDQILALPLEEQSQALLAAFRLFAAFDEIELKPATSADGGRTLLFPAPDELPVVLAEITDITLEKQSGGLVLRQGQVDVAVRPSHVDSATIQELLCGSPQRQSSGGSSAAGPRIDPASVRFVDDQTITFSVDTDLHQASVKKGAFSVTFFNDTGWHKVAVDGVSFDSATRTITLTLQPPMAGKVVRLIARGAGETPLLGANLVPLAGPTSGPPATRHNGYDFVFMHERS